MLEIKLSAKEEQTVREVAAMKAQAEGISAEQALKDLLGIGLNSYMEQRRWQEFRAGQKPFNPFAAARGEAQA